MPAHSSDTQPSDAQRNDTFTAPANFNPDYDAVIIGGGIQGTGCAQALAARGFSVLLLEQNKLASGTSSRSSKLIHGGLRYLETAQFSLVRKSLNERALLCELAPGLVELKDFYLPVYRSSRVGRLKMAAGLGLYSMLGNFRKDARFCVVPKSEWDSLQGLKLDDLVCVYRYHDAQTDDQQLTRAVAHSAQKLGAT
ncbi:MAG: FAD-dependent oxidoreductase, partial [Pseudomonadales bacterium]|nr:FAD-dependent oxidoreductase [Pseudomonadales bacterium]